MKAIILAGGAGRRLRRIIKDIPKPMAPIGGKPFLEFLILHLIKFNIKEIILSIGYKGDIIKAYFESGEKWGAHIKYCKENEPLGTGGAIRKASEMIKGDHFIVMNGDSFLDVDFNHLISYHKNKKANATICLAYVDNTGRYGRVETDKNGEIVKFAEKGFEGAGYINGGVYLLNNKVMHDIPDGQVSVETEVFPMLIKRGLYGMFVKGSFIDIGIPQDYLSLCNDPEMFSRLIRTGN